MKPSVTELRWPAVDALFCSAANDQKIDIFKQLNTVLQGNTKLSAVVALCDTTARLTDLSVVITQCCMVELYKLGPVGQAAVDLAKTFERRKCNHREAIANDDCIRSVVGMYIQLRSSRLLTVTGDSNKHRYVIATQSQNLRVWLRGVKAVPIIHIKKAVVVLEPPSDETKRIKAEVSGLAVAKSTEIYLKPLESRKLRDCSHQRLRSKVFNS